MSELNSIKGHPRTGSPSCNLYPESLAEGVKNLIPLIPHSSVQMSNVDGPTFQRRTDASLAHETLEAAAERFVRDGWPDRESQRAESRLVANNPFRVIDVGSQAYYELARQWNDLPCPACGHRSHTGKCPVECDDDARFTCACGADGGAW